MTTDTAEDLGDLAQRLSEPFEASEVKWKPITTKDNKALVIGYVDARVVQDRLDDVFGVVGWQDDYELLPDGNVLCRLRGLVNGQWVTKADVGGPSEQPDGGDRLKAAFSDALKRAAVKWGIGRYLYRLGGQWVDYDPQKKKLLGKPTLPAWANPAAAKTIPAKQPLTREVGQTSKPPAAAAKSAAGRPANGDELMERLGDYDARLAQEGVCKRGELLEHVTMAGHHYHNFPVYLRDWSGRQEIDFAVEETKLFEAKCRAAMPKVAG